MPTGPIPGGETKPGSVNTSFPRAAGSQKSLWFSGAWPEVGMMIIASESPRCFQKGPPPACELVE